MKKYNSSIFAGLILLLLLPSIQAKADSWSDPDWKDMLDSSHVVAMIRYTSDGAFRAKAKAIRVYKGNLTNDEIWISGFSNRYGPIDSVSKGDTFIVFLKHYKPSPDALKNWEEMIREKPELTDFFEAVKAGKAYYVRTPTSGDLSVKGKSVQYDLLQTSQYTNMSYYPLSEFEAFLTAYYSFERDKFRRRTLKKVKKTTGDNRLAQYLMMLRFTDHRSIDPVFTDIARAAQPESSLALARLLGNINNTESRDLLVQLLSHENSLVQGEAVRQLADYDPDFLGPILINHLDSAGLGGLYPSNIMDPVTNSMDGGKIEIIRTLGKIGYQPAVSALLPLLETEDEYLFKLVIHVLTELGSKAYIPYLNHHLEKKTESLIFSICRIIAKNNLTECKTALMKFISSHDKNADKEFEYAISRHMGLAHFDDEETVSFLLKDFEKLLSEYDSIDSDNLETWLIEYTQVFKDLKIPAARPLIYQGIFRWFGYNQDFVRNNDLFSMKRSLEDSLNREAYAILKDYKVKEIQSIVFIKNTNEYGSEFTPAFDQMMIIRLVPSNLNLFEDDETWKVLLKIREKVSARLNIPLQKVSSRSGSQVSNLDERFSSSIDWSPMREFYKYAIELPDQKDLEFLKALKKNDFAKSDLDKRQLNETIQSIEEKLKNSLE